jgi:hypothetical protein
MRDLETRDTLLEIVAGWRGVAATYTKGDGLTLIISRKIGLLPETHFYSAAECTPTIAATIISRIGLGNCRELEAMITICDKVVVQRGPDGVLHFTASGKLST